MPATFSHPAAVLPLRRLPWLNFAALVIGSMSPDFGYFIGVGGTAAHTWRGSVLICVPSAAGAFLLFLLLRKPVCHLLPQPHRGALLPLCDRLPQLRFMSIAGIAVSLLLGAWTHIVWDDFTHAPGFFVQQLPILQTPLFTFGGMRFRGYFLLQHLSSFVGLIVLLVSYWRWLQRQPITRAPDERDEWRYLTWAAILLLAAVVALPVAAREAATYHGFMAVRVFAYRSTIYSLAAFVPLVVAAALLAQSRRGRS